MNPYNVLGVPRDADDRTIREAWLKAIRQASPDSDPERFTALSRAYEEIKDETSRRKHELFNKECPGDSPLDAVVRHFRLQGPPRPPALDAMRQFLRKCAQP